MKKNIASFITVLLLAACAPSRMMIKAYEGQDIASQELAYLKPRMGSIIVAIDGDRSKNISVYRGEFQSPVDVDIALKPGKHRITYQYNASFQKGMSPYSVIFQSKEDHNIEFDAIAGHKYLLSLHSDGHMMVVNIEDVTDDLSKWCISPDYCKRGPSK